MKNLFLIALIISISSLKAFSQILEQCEVILTEKTEDRSRPYLGNNKFLLEVLAEHQIFLPKDYIEKLDEKGRYNGMDLKLEDLRNPTESGKQPSNENDRVLFKGPITYYMPVVIYNHANSSGQTAFSNQEIYNYFGENFRRYRENSGSIEFFINKFLSFQIPLIIIIPETILHYLLPILMGML